MGGDDGESGALFSDVSCEALVLCDQPLRPARAIVDQALVVLSSSLEGLSSAQGRPSIAPEKLLRAVLLQAFFGIHSERQLLEELDYNVMFRWLVGLSADAPVWDASSFSKNRDRLLDGDIARRFLPAVIEQPRVKALMSDEHSPSTAR